MPVEVFYETFEALRVATSLVLHQFRPGSLTRRASTMDFTFTEEQETVGKVARQLFEHRATPEHLTDARGRRPRYDAALWSELASSDLLGIALPESVGGSGGGFLELACLLGEVGCSVAPVPGLRDAGAGCGHHCTARRLGDPASGICPAVVDGSTLLTAALAEPGNSDPPARAPPRGPTATRWQLDGTKDLVPAAQLADAIVVSAQTERRPGAVRRRDCESHGVDVTPATTTNGEPLRRRRARPARSVPAAHRARAAPTLVGSLYSRALDRLVRHADRRRRTCFEDRRLLHQRTRAVRQTDRLLPGGPAAAGRCVHRRRGDPVDHVARGVADRGGSTRGPRGAPSPNSGPAEAGARVAASAQQVHGGMGIDVTYPLSRYFLWAKQIELSLGSASQQLARLGSAYPEGIRNDLHRQPRTTTLAWNVDQRRRRSHADGRPCHHHADRRGCHRVP